MIRKIFRSTLFVTLGTLLLTTVLTMGFLYSYFNQLQKDQLQAETNLVAQGVTADGQAYLQQLDVPNLRVTWVDHQGTVLYDSQSAASSMDNHANRQEIKQALVNGRGESTRYSATLTTQSLYLAQRLEDGTVIRLSITQHSIVLLVIRMALPLAIIVLLVFLISIWISRSLAGRIVSPLNQLDLDHPLENDIYDEVSPLLSRIDQQQTALREQEGLLRQREVEFETIIAKIKEGILLLNAHSRIISLNQAAQEIFRTDATCLGKDATHLTRELSFHTWLEQGLTGQKEEGILTLGAVSYRVLVRPVLSDEQVTGLVVLLFDVTEQLQIEQLRHEFTANVSHELKTPLHVISGYSEMMENGLVAVQDVPRFAGKIHQESHRMVQLIEDIIRLSQLDEVQQVPMEKLDLYKISHNVLESLASKADQAQVQWQLTGQSASVLGNPALIHSVIYNLCDNAITYNRENGRLDVSVTTEEDKVILDIKDTGLGISKEDQDRIFERFYRVDKSRSRKLGGTGLGLSIVKHALKLHEASIQVDSQLGQGTTMRLVFHKAG